MTSKKVGYAIAIIILLFLGVFDYFLPNQNQKVSSQASTQNTNQIVMTTSTVTTSTPTANTKISEPISNALNRVTKKSFGLYVTPKNSPVSPEKFTGYHTGVDFETLPSEQNTDVPIYAICDGTLTVKEYASGYGGVAVESCKINNADVTVIYGHLRLSSITPKVNENLKAGEQIAVLGTGYSTETDGERKHLHLGIHKGKSINILGYVQNKNDLGNWINAVTLLR